MGNSSVFDFNKAVANSKCPTGIVMIKNTIINTKKSRTNIERRPDHLSTVKLKASHGRFLNQDGPFGVSNAGRRGNDAETA